MKRYEKYRLEQDRQTDELLATERGRAEYWDRLGCDGRESSMIGLLESTLELPGDVIECGVYRGATFMQIARAVREHAPQKSVYGCDSYEGFPEDQVTRVDVGRFRRMSKVRKKFKLCSDTPDRIHRIFDLYAVRGECVKGYFSDTLSRFRDTEFCFIHIDVDIYASYLECLEQLYENLVPGGVVVFDEYRTATWPGAARAVDEFFADLPEQVSRCDDRLHGSWYVRKPVRVEEAVA